MNEKLNDKKGLIILLAIFLIILIIVVISSNKNNAPVPPQNQNINKQTKKQNLDIIIGSIPDPDFETLDVTMLDIQYTLIRTIDTKIDTIPFYAIKDNKSDGFIAILTGSTGKAIFLVSTKALNQTEKSDLEKSIKAINGTAKTYNNNLQFAGAEYDPADYLSL